jgi:hypothetical protein
MCLNGVQNEKAALSHKTFAAEECVFVSEMLCIV